MKDDIRDNLDEANTEYNDDLSDYEEAVAAFAPVEMLSVDDPRVPGDIRYPTGTITQFGETLGGVDFTIASTNPKKDLTVEQGKYLFEGVAKADFILTGSILNAMITVSVVSYFDEYSVKFAEKSTTKTQEEQLQATQEQAPSITATLRDFIVNAANETIDDVNGVRTPQGLPNDVKAPNGVPNITRRALLGQALRKVFESNLPSVPQIQQLKLSFNDLDSVYLKQVLIGYNGKAFFPTSIDYLRNIINENSLISNYGNIRNRSRSSININADKVAIRFNIKSNDGRGGFKTNTNYQFTGINKNITFFPKNTKEGDKTIVEYLEGFNISDFKTGKQLPLFEAYTVDRYKSISVISTIATSSVFSPISSTNYLMTSIDFNSIKNDSTFIDYNNMVSITASNIALQIGGNSIKFKTFKIFDKDETITKMEIEDDKSNKYPVSLAPIDSNNLDCGAYMRVTGLRRSTRYTFRKLYITATPEKDPITKTFNLVTLSYVKSTASLSKEYKSSSETGKVTAIAHNISIRTTDFSEPKLFIELDDTKSYVEDKEGNFIDINAPVTLQIPEGGVAKKIPVFIPNPKVKLPNNIEMPAVKNDKTALRYVVEVYSGEENIKELIVNGLKGDEQFSVQRIDGKDRIYFILTLFNLSENRDYGFLTLELTYTDLDERDLVARQILSDINRITDVALSNGVIRQYPDQTLDNKTGPELSERDYFNVTLFSTTTLEARKAHIPVFIDDMNGRFTRIEFKKPEDNPDLNLELDGSVLKFTNLKPKTDAAYKIDFFWLDKNNQEKSLSKYAKISTPQVPAVDVKKTDITTTDKTAEIKFTLYSEPKSPIKDVVLNDNKIKFTWDTSTLTLSLRELKTDKEYNDLEIIFKLENGLVTRYKIDAFKTSINNSPPTGEVADFVKKVYDIALGRSPEVQGWKFWVQKLESKELPVTQFIYDLMRQDEFINRDLSKEDFIKSMYQIIVGREPDEEGQKFWEGKYDEYELAVDSLADLRIRVASDMMGSQEFKDYVSSLGLKY